MSRLTLPLTSHKETAAKEFFRGSRSAYGTLAATILCYMVSPVFHIHSTQQRVETRSAGNVVEGYAA